MKRLNALTDTFRELLVLYIGVVALGAAVFAFAEDKPFHDAVWWAFVTAMTVGYGDIFPVTQIGRLAGILLMHLVPLFLAPIIVTRLVSKLLDERDKFSHEEQEHLKAELREIKLLLSAAQERR